MNNLGGHCIETLIRTFNNIEHDRPTVFVAYTIKGWRMPLAGYKDNHAGLMTPNQMAAFQADMGVEKGQEWEALASLENPDIVQEWLATVPFFNKGTRRFDADVIPTSGPVFLNDRIESTQAGFGKILDHLARSDAPVADRIVTTSPDVTVSTNLGGWVNREGLFARMDRADTFRDEKIPST